MNAAEASRGEPHPAHLGLLGLLQRAERAAPLRARPDPMALRAARSLHLQLRTEFENAATSWRTQADAMMLRPCGPAAWGAVGFPALLAPLSHRASSPPAIRGKKAMKRRREAHWAALRASTGGPLILSRECPCPLATGCGRSERRVARPTDGPLRTLDSLPSRRPPSFTVERPITLNGSEHRLKSRI